MPQGLIWIRSRFIIGSVSRSLRPDYAIAEVPVVMITYLHHSDPTLPHYRKGQWTFLRGAAATVDRPLLGWLGRFFFHNISHDHVAHRKCFLRSRPKSFKLRSPSLGIADFFLRAPFCRSFQMLSLDTRLRQPLGLTSASRQWPRDNGTH